LVVVVLTVTGVERDEEFLEDFSFFSFFSCLPRSGRSAVTIAGSARNFSLSGVSPLSSLLPNCAVASDD
jgi:hypothetical protein